MKCLLSIVLLVLTFGVSGFAQEQSLDSTTLSQRIAQVEKFNPYEATQKYLDTLTPEQKAKSDAYFEGGYWLSLWSLVYGIAVAWIFLSKGLSNRIKRIATKVNNVNIQNLIYLTLYFVAAYILTFPYSYYKDFYREHQYDLSNLSFGGWMKEEMIALVLTILLGSVVIMLIYMAMRKLKENWWVWAGFITFIFLILILFIGPVFISPLFNEYKPLEDENVKEQILSMARANSVPADNVYQFDASKQTDRISANVSGIGSTIRVSLNDNLLKRCTPEEVKAVMGHELGHFVLNHGYEDLIYLGLILFIGFAFVNWSFHKAMKRWGTNWGVGHISDINGFPLFVVLFSVYLFFAQPFINSVIRSAEMEADVFGLNASREPDGFASVAMKLSEYRKIDPGYWEEIIFFDHPSGHTRVLTSMKWKAENLRTSE